MGRASLFSRNPDQPVDASACGAKLAGNLSMWAAEFAFALARSGNRVGAQRIRNELTERAQTGSVSCYDLAVCCAGLGEKDDAINYLEQACKERLMKTISIGDPEFEFLNGDARFTAIRRFLNLPEA